MKIFQILVPREAVDTRVVIFIPATMFQYKRQAVSNIKKKGALILVKLGDPRNRKFLEKHFAEYEIRLKR